MVRLLIALVAIPLMIPAARSVSERQRREKAAAAERDVRAAAAKRDAEAKQAAERLKQLVSAFPARAKSIEAEVGGLERAVRAKDWTAAEKATASLSSALVPLTKSELANDPGFRAVHARWQRQEKALELHRADERTREARRRAELDARAAGARDAQEDSARRALLGAYESNEVGADARYKGKVVQVRGRIGDIKKEILGRPYVTLGSGSQYEIPMVQCVFNAGKGAETASLRPGEEVTLRGKVDGLLMNVLLSDCALVRR